MALLTKSAFIKVKAIKSAEVELNLFKLKALAGDDFSSVTKNKIDFLSFL